MKISQLFQQKKAVFSLEVFPPKKNGTIDAIYRTLDSVRDLKPDYVSVTYGAGGNPADDSTCRIARAIKEDYGLIPLAHLTCLNSDKAQIYATLDELEQAGIENVLALRGDKNPDRPPKGEFKYASELIRTIQERGGFDVAAACYPEGHPDSPTLEADIRHLKEKVDAGASHLITQLFFDNEDYYNFLYKLREAGIQTPVQAGIMPVTNKSQIERMVSMCGASIPKRLVRILSRYGHNPAAMMDAGIAYATEQIIDLLSNGAHGIHLYTMNNPEVARRISGSIGSIVHCINERED